MTKINDALVSLQVTSLAVGDDFLETLAEEAQEEYKALLSKLEAQQDLIKQMYGALVSATVTFNSVEPDEVTGELAYNNDVTNAIKAAESLLYSQN